MSDWTVDRNKDHFFYDANGDGIVDSVYGIDMSGNLISQSIGTGGKQLHFHRNPPDDWVAKYKTKHESELGSKFTHGSDPNYEGQSLSDIKKQETGAYKKYLEGAEASGYVAEDADASGVYGAQNITREDFFTPQGGQQGFSYVVQM